MWTDSAILSFVPCQHKKRTTCTGLIASSKIWLSDVTFNTSHSSLPWKDMQGNWRNLPCFLGWQFWKHSFPTRFRPHCMCKTVIECYSFECQMESHWPGKNFERYRLLSYIHFTISRNYTRSIELCESKEPNLPNYIWFKNDWPLLIVCIPDECLLPPHWNVGI